MLFGARYWTNLCGSSSILSGWELYMKWCMHIYICIHIINRHAHTYMHIHIKYYTSIMYIYICIHTDRCSWMTLNVGVLLLMHHARTMPSAWCWELPKSSEVVYNPVLVSVLMVLSMVPSWDTHQTRRLCHGVRDSKRFAVIWCCKLRRLSLAA